ncbi:MAG: GNAT family N-acetyltransferase, partial [Proteobacteria bacterium]|nr:GNAT family N-acetyltransferase [Pseudomonadota bacterium]
LEPGKDIHRKSAELGYWLAEPYWGRGIVTACLLRYMEFQFDRYDWLRVYAEPFADNPASIRVLEKCGFSREGLLRQHAVKAGQVMDIVLYARIRLLG